MKNIKKKIFCKNHFLSDVVGNIHTYIFLLKVRHFFKMNMTFMNFKCIDALKETLTFYENEA